jgi:hypothetical protein
LKAPSDSLFQLIKSLSTSEKRYFKLFGLKDSAKKESNYIKLFNAIDKQDKYDEEKIRKTLSKEFFVKNLAVEKHYLYQVILESLSVYYKDISVESTIMKLRQHTEVLRSKGMTDQSLNILNKAKRLAYENERYSELLSLLSMERLISWREKGRAEEIHKEQKIVMEQYNYLTELKYLVDYIGAEFLRLGPPRKESDYEHIFPLFEHPILNIPEEKLSFSSKQNFYSVKYLEYQIKGDYQSMYESASKMVAIFEDKPEKITLNPLGYLGGLQNYIYSCYRIQKWKEVYKDVKKINAVSVKSVEIEIRKFFISTFASLAALNASGEFDKGKSLADQVEAGLEKYKGKIRVHNEFILYSILFTNYFGTGNYKKALACHNRMASHENYSVKSDFFSMTKIFLLLVYYEMKNMASLEYALISTYRHLLKKERLFEFEKAIIDFIKKTAEIGPGTNMKPYFKKLRDEFIEIAKNPYEKNALGHFDFISWVESKVENKSFGEILKAKASSKPLS